MSASPTIHLHSQDLPDDFPAAAVIAVDTEAMGLNPNRDRLCLVQLATGDGTCHLVQTNTTHYQAPNLVKLLTDCKIVKVFHFARFDVGILQHTYNIKIENIYCTKIASKLVRTYTDRHGLKDLCKELLGVELSKEQQSSDWGAPFLTSEQQRYAARDVLYLHQLKTKLDAMLIREQRQAIAQACFDFIPLCSRLDVMGFNDMSVFHH